MTLARFKIIWIMCRCNFHHTSAKFRVSHVIQNDWNFTTHQRQQYHLAVKMQVPFIFGVHRNRSIAQHCFRTSGRNNQEFIRPYYRVAHMPQTALGIFVDHFQVTQRRVATWAPVHHVLPAIDQIFFIQPNKDFANRTGKACVHGEPAASPIHRIADLPHLRFNASPRLFFPLPNLFLKLNATQLMTGDALFGQLPFHHHLRGNACVVHTWRPQRVVSAHAIPTDNHVHQRVVQHVSDVQCPGHIGRRNGNGKRFTGFGRVSYKKGRFFPPFGPMRFKPLGLVNFL